MRRGALQPHRSSLSRLAQTSSPLNTLFPSGEHAVSRRASDRSEYARWLLGRPPGNKGLLERWYRLVRAARWISTDEVQKAAPRAKVLNRERVRFEIAEGSYRLVAAFDFRRQIAFAKFIATHVEYDRVDALTASQF